MLIYNSRNSFGLLAHVSYRHAVSPIYNSRNSFGLLAGDTKNFVITNLQ